ncbi:MAG: acyl-CoA thioesterase [Ferruginibacter sp.]
MEKFEKSIEIRWSDLDPNFHVLHSKYYDFAAYTRMAFFVDHGITPAVMQDLHIGPILFREECVFKREIVFGDIIKVSLMLAKNTADYSRWSIVHELKKNEDTLSAIINVDGAWIDTNIRKLALPPKDIHSLFESAPKAPGYFLMEK